MPDFRTHTVIPFHFIYLAKGDNAETSTLVSLDIEP